MKDQTIFMSKYVLLKLKHSLRILFLLLKKYVSSVLQRGKECSTPQLRYNVLPLSTQLTILKTIKQFATAET